jgi:hypothetical protein
VLCWECGERQATVPDHYPPLSAHAHVEGSGCCKLLPHCLRCSRAQGARQASAKGRPAEALDELLDPLGFPPDHPVWDVSWIDPLRDVPANASWPRLMTPPHPQAVGSLGPEFAQSAAERMGQPLRWWQELAATRLLEVDAEGRLVWPAVLLSTARQVGKSVLLRELLMWRLTQGGPMVVFAAETELRTNEWIALERRDLDRAGQAITVQRRYAGGVSTPYPKTVRSRRRVPLSARALEALEQLPSRLDTPFVFPASQGGWIELHGWRQRHWYPALEAAAIDKRGPYHLRHTFATEALAAGVSIFELARLMGTSVAMIDERYGHLARHSEQAIRAKLNARNGRGGVEVASAPDPSGGH